MPPSASQRPNRALALLLGGAGAFPWGAALLLSACLVATILAVPYLPAHDGPQHLFLGELAIRYGDPGSRYAEFLAPGFQVTALGFQALFVPLARWLDWASAQRGVLLLLTLGWSWGFARLTWAVRPERAVLGLLGFPMALGWALYMGFWSYQAASALGMLALADACTDQPWGKLRMMRLCAWFVATAMAHVFVAELVLGMLAVGALVGRSPEPRAKSLLKLLVVATPVLLVGALTWLGRDADAPALLTSPSLADKPALLLRTFVPGPYWRSAPVLAVALGGLALGAPWRQPRLPARQRALWWSGACALLGAAVAPMAVAQWDFLFPRFTPFAVAALSALVPVERLPLGRQRWTAAATTAFAVASLGWALGFHIDLGVRVRDALSAVDQPLGRSGPRLGIVLDPYAGLPSDPLESPVPFYGPLLNLGTLYCAAQGGIPPRTFTTTPAVSPFVLRPESVAAYPTIPDPSSLALAYSTPGPTAEERAALVDWLAPFGARFDDVIWWGRPEDHERWRARGYATDWQRGGLMVARFVGCPADLEVELEEGAEPPGIVVDYGWVGGAEVPFAARALAPRDRVQLRLDYAPCGGVWFKPRSMGAHLRWRCAAEVARDRFVAYLHAPATTLSCRASAPP